MVLGRQWQRDDIYSGLDHAIAEPRLQDVALHLAHCHTSLLQKDRISGVELSEPSECSSKGYSTQPRAKFWSARKPDRMYQSNLHQARWYISISISTCDLKQGYILAALLSACNRQDM